MREGRGREEGGKNKGGRKRERRRERKMREEGDREGGWEVRGRRSGEGDAVRTSVYRQSYKPANA